MSKETTALSALKLALEALEAHADIGIKSDKAITALREALNAPLAEQPAPVAKPHEQEPIKQGWDVDTLLDKPIPLKDFYKPAQQEPVAWMYDWICDGKLLEGWIAHKESEIPRSLASNIRPLYTSPPTLSLAQRTWVGLTYEEAKEIYTRIHGYDSSKRIAEAIEAKLKAKNFA